ncbi:hypothetical protein NC653_010672 [Populus alba x Populus x berolinensis]|uniref:Reverse transcriptase Ty1/copia-type domain-containing protein n=1 Tax=Populus alba x Populus x berolinensis TaxID=444605 RepID=A0AAD6R081_9ROSI|nr:hypothetical protein NC653_010666 [Populus alba x Populus x berolinensis]KAJ6999985.1 hypothetical protein NC653_010672 [Populus alba x Populus x berolinensis]
MDEEIHAIDKNDTWKLTDLPENKKAIGVKWVYKTKKNAKGEVQRYKASLVTKGYKLRKAIEGRKGQGRQPPPSQPPAVTDQPLVTSCHRRPPAAFTPKKVERKSGELSRHEEVHHCLTNGTNYEGNYDKLNVQYIIRRTRLNYPAPSQWRLLKINAPEWGSALIIGCLAAISS